MSEKYILIPEKDLDSRIEELIPQSKHNEKVGEYDSEGVIISELQSLKQKGEVVEIMDFSKTPYGTILSMDELEESDYKLIKKV